MRNLIRLVLGLSLAATAFAVLPAQAVACSGVQVPNTANLAAVVQGHGPGTTYCLQAGIYEVSASILQERGDQFIGPLAVKNSAWVPSSTGAFWNTAPSAKIVGQNIPLPGHVFKYAGTGGSGTTRWRYVDISGGTGYNGDWNTGFGIGMGGGSNELLLSRVHSNNRAIGGWSGLIQDSEIDHNGRGPKTVVGYAYARGNYLHQSGAFHGDGVTQAAGDGSMEVSGNRIIEPGCLGVSWEISNTSFAAFNNDIHGANPTNQPYCGGLQVLSSQNANIYSNRFGVNTGYGFSARKDSRGFSLSNVRLHDNRLNGDVVLGCGQVGVTCSNNQ